MSISFRGDSEIFFRTAVRSVSPAQWDALMQNVSQAMSYSGKVTHAQFSRPDLTLDPFTANYDYEREKSGDWDNLRILPQLPPIALGPADEKDLPVAPINFGPPNLQIAHAEMKLPPGWSAELPAAIHAKSSFATLDKTYKLENGTLITDRRYEVLLEKIPASDWREYQKWYKDAGIDGETFIPLTRATVSPGAAAYDKDAEILISQAVQLERSKSWDPAQEKLDKAKAINPHQAFLWSNYGFLAAEYGKNNEAIEDYKREIAEHPVEQLPYRLLAALQGLMHKDTEAEEPCAIFSSSSPVTYKARRCSAPCFPKKRTLRAAVAANDADAEAVPCLHG